MPKTRLRKILPTHEKIKNQKFLKIFGKLLDKKDLWSLSRKKVLGAVFIGIFVACLPMPLQMVLATFLAIIFSVNLPLSFALIFISNPFTMPPLFYFEYHIGKLLIKPENPIEFDFESMYDNFGEIALSLWSGAIVVGIFSSVVCVVVVNFLWIYSVRKKRRNAR